MSIIKYYKKHYNEYTIILYRYNEVIRYCNNDIVKKNISQKILPFFHL